MGIQAQKEARERSAKHEATVQKIGVAMSKVTALEAPELCLHPKSVCLVELTDLAHDIASDRYAWEISPKKMKSFESPPLLPSDPLVLDLNYHHMDGHLVSFHVDRQVSGRCQSPLI